MLDQAADGRYEFPVSDVKPHGKVSQCNENILEDGDSDQYPSCMHVFGEDLLDNFFRDQELAHGHGHEEFNFIDDDDGRRKNVEVLAKVRAKIVPKPT